MQTIALICQTCHGDTVLSIRDVSGRKIGIWMCPDCQLDVAYDFTNAKNVEAAMKNLLSTSRPSMTRSQRIRLAIFLRIAHAMRIMRMI
jgi:ribosomal protein L37AE/L43A